jgi:hypothetical protein
MIWAGSWVTRGADGSAVDGFKPFVAVPIKSTTIGTALSAALERCFVFRLASKRNGDPRHAR